MDDLATFFANFETIAEAPGGVGRLRRMILELAVRGQLVPQNPLDEPADKGLGKRTIHMKASEEPFQLPPGWAWSTLGNLGEFRGGGTPSKSNPRFWNGAVPWVSPKDMKRDEITDSEDHITEAAVAGSAVQIIPSASILMVVRGMILAHSFPTAITRKAVTINQDMKALTPFREGMERFLLLVTRGSRTRVLDLIEHSSHGTCRLPFPKLATMPIAVPPMPEQHRIVAKVDELMALCDRLEERQRAQAAERDRFRASALDALANAATDEELLIAWARVREHFDGLADSNDGVAAFRRVVLQLGVRGGLATSVPSDEPATILLKRIRSSIDRRILARAEAIAAGEGPRVPHECPPNWATAWFGHLFSEVFTGPFGTSLKASEYIAKGTPVINPQNMVGDAIVPTAATSVGPETLRRLSSFRVRKGDVVVARRGEMGRCSVVDTREDGWLCGTGSLVLRPAKGVVPRFIAMFLRSPWTASRLAGDSVGSTMDNLNQRIMLSLPIGLPPTPEQKRIVLKVDALLALCDLIESACLRRDEAARALAEATIRGVLAAGQRVVDAGVDASWPVGTTSPAGT